LKRSGFFLIFEQKFHWSFLIKKNKHRTLIEISSNANRIGEATGDPGKSFLFFLMANCPNQKVLVVLSGAAGISGGWTVEPDYLAKWPYCQN